MILADRGLRDEAIRHYRKAIEAKPSYAEAHNNLGAILLFGPQKRLDEAIVHFRKATEIDPRYEDARRNLGTALDLQNRGGGVTEGMRVGEEGMDKKKNEKAGNGEEAIRPLPSLPKPPKGSKPPPRPM
jgi:tetratricopeptide (TPR) repeat protein